jgi:hypothetical protein
MEGGIQSRSLNAINRLGHRIPLNSPGATFSKCPNSSAPKGLKN